MDLLNFKNKKVRVLYPLLLLVIPLAFINLDDNMGVQVGILLLI